MATIQVMRSKLRDEQKIDDGVINKQLEELSKKIKEGTSPSVLQVIISIISASN
jgi:hypothetical protein